MIIISNSLETEITKWQDDNTWINTQDTNWKNILKEKSMKIKSKEIKFTPSPSLDVVTNKLYVEEVADGSELNYDSQNWDVGNIALAEDGKIHVDLSVYCEGYDGIYDIGIAAVDDGGNESDMQVLNSVPLDFIAPDPVSDLELI